MSKTCASKFKQRRRLRKSMETNYTILDHFLHGVEAQPHKAFILFKDETFTYRDADEHSNRAGRVFLQSGLVKAGDTVALFMGNEPVFVWLWLGLAKIGCSAAFLNYNIRSKSLLHSFSCSGAKTLVAAEELQDAVEEVLPHLLEHQVTVYILADRCRTANMKSFKDKMSQASSEPLSRDLRSQITLQNPAVYIYTSGTTGVPKAAVLTYAKVWNMSSLLLQAGVNSNDVIYTCLPLYHSTGFFGVIAGIERENRSFCWTICNCGLMQTFGAVYAVTPSPSECDGKISRMCFFPYAVIKYDVKEGKPLRDSSGLCIEVAKGEPGLLVCEISLRAPFSGYAGDLQQTEKKRLHNVRKKGDVYFNTGDLIRVDEDNFVYFHDRVGDTFRWKGENVATTEVADIITLVDCIREANVYGVEVPGQEGRAGMAAVILSEGRKFDSAGIFKHVEKFLPTYARPRFIRIQLIKSHSGQVQIKFLGITVICLISFAPARSPVCPVLSGAPCSMLIWITALLGLGLLVLPFLRTLFPYLGEDCAYILRSLRLGARLQRYKWGKPFYSILDCFLDAARRQPGKTFVRFEGREYTYGEADRRSNRVARALRDHAGLKEGDTVALFLPNEPDFVWIWLGLSKLGCPAALLNFNIRSRSLLHCFSCCGAKVIIASPELQDAVEEILPTLREQGISVYLLSESCGTQGINTLSDKISQASDEPLSQNLRANVHFRSTALYIYTSGTTGLPKAAVVTHERVWAASFVQAACGVTSEDIFYINLPLYHSAGFLIGTVGAIERGMTIVLRRKFSASQFWDDCRKYNVTVIQYIGETMRYLCNTPKRDNDKNHKVRIAIGNGVRTDIWSEFLNRFGDIKVRELYAATEGNIGFINYTSKIGAVGRVNFVHRFFFPYNLIKFDIEKEEPVRNSEGLCIEAARGETGLLVGKITQRSPFTGYAGNRQQTEKKRLRDVLKKGDLYFNTGDLLRFDHNNFMYFQDRVGDTFRQVGTQVMERRKRCHGGGRRHSHDGSVSLGSKCLRRHEGRIGMACVTLKEGEEFDCADAYKQVTNYLPAYARPRFIRIQPCLELTGTFKMKKVKLVEEGFNPAHIKDPLYFLDTEKETYVPLTGEIYRAIISREIKL
ncbi:hypothetical protein L3Q82_023835 [Scortum barcoo]|uniref:Uncharacterized protein n=1 Tax=Scortum barcoo TaxID=214431 RepID=A0ACB8WWZ2_9TELE|nr:hypothetical protein L3Q82_023835 [Scortum barcoo]